jgi:creatinine amidohydrolase
MDTPWVHELSWRAVRDYLDSGNDLALLPVGAVEQHGPHMPMGHDAFAAQNICADAARRAGVLAYPTLWYGWSHHHMALPGTVTLRPTTLTAIVTDILKSMLYHGFSRAIVVNGHRRANLPPIEIAVNELRHQTGAALAVVDVGIVAFDRVAEIRTSPPGGVGHADEMETSHALYMNPTSSTSNTPRPG